MSAISSQFSSSGGHSAEVRITLILDGERIPVAQLGPGFLLLDSPSDRPPTGASIELRADESESCWPIYLPKGISAGSKQVAIRTAAG